MTPAPFVPACVSLGIVRAPAAMQVNACQSTPVAEPIRYRSKANVALQVQAEGFCALPDLQDAADGDSPGI